MGIVKFILCNRIPLWMTGSDPPWHRVWSPHLKDDLEGLVLHGSWSKVPDELWTSSTLKVVIQVMHRSTRRTWQKRAKTSSSWPPPGWVVRLNSRVKHHEVGGVTNSACSICVISREDAIADWSLPATVQASLGDVLGVTLPGFPCSVPSEGEANTFKGILDWKARGNPIIADTVFGDGGVKRKMTTRELASALDFPEDRTDCMTEENLHLLTNTEIPGKIVYSAIHCLSSYFDL